MRFPFEPPLGQQSGQILFGKKTLRIRTNTCTPKAPKTPEDFARIAAADLKRLRRLQARELNTARSIGGAR